MKTNAFAKINLTLEILGTRRNDGFHDILSVMHKIPFGDRVSLEVTKGNTLEFSCSENVCKDEDNLAYRAFMLYREKALQKGHEDFGGKIHIEKVMPTGAGLAGGSADGAAILDMLNKELCVFSDKEMHSLALVLGSDVPFCLEQHHCCLCSGRGEIMRDIKGLSNVFCLVAKPRQNLATSGIYKSYDELYGDNYSKNASLAMEEALYKNDISKISSLLVNDFEEICVKRLPEIESLRKTMLYFDALGSRMSGSGSSVYGLFDNEKKMRECEKTLLEEGLFCCGFAY